MIKTINPATEEVIQEFQESTWSEVDQKLAASLRAQQDWKFRPIGQRLQCFQKLAQLLQAEEVSLAEVITTEMGKNIKEARAEVRKCVAVIDFYLEHSEAHLQAVDLKSDFQKSYISPQPLGVILGIMPWNFPFYQVFRFAVPTLIAGNTVLLKHAPNVTECSLQIHRLFMDAGFGDGIYTSLVVSHQVAAQVIEDPRVRGVSFTGSTRGGRQVASLSGQSLKKTLLELGGSDPSVVLDDADLDLAVDRILSSRMINSGQSCIAAKRFIVTEKNYDEFRGRMVQSMADFSFGDPMNEGYRLGPLARKDLRDQLDQQVQRCRQQGIQVLVGGEVPSEKGFYYPATLLEDVRPDTVAFAEELFGPVGSLIRASDEAEAIRLANQTSFGLGAAIYSRDLERACRIAETEIESGQVFVNDIVRSDPRLPFGGVKNSGYGRELSHLALTEFCNLKTVAGNA